MTKDDLFFRAADLITKIHDMEADLEAQGGDHEITSLQSNLLKILYFSGPQNLSGLSHCMHMNLPNSSREVKKLTELGYIQKTSSPDDRRKTELSLTVRGKEKVNLSMDEMKAAFF
ncbi:MAG: MarR family transcriptional regulator, partial [Spirochaetales bacterium]|nr:MarR family transcriptional regulator [Spirochaetales bacterium]